jgi:hypothetical protein
MVVGTSLVRGKAAAMRIHLATGIRTEGSGFCQSGC